MLLRTSQDVITLTCAICSSSKASVSYDCGSATVKETRFQLEKTREVMEEDILIKKKKTRKYTLCLSSAP